MSKSFLLFIGLSFILVSFSSYAAVTLPEEGADFPSQPHLLHLSKGWNVVGYTLDTETPVGKIKSVCELEPYKGHEVWEYAGDQNNPWAHPSELRAPKGYYIKSKEDCSIVLSGKNLKLEKLVLKSGWNLITSPRLVIFNSILGSCREKLDDEEYVLGLNEDTGKMDFRTSVMELGNAYWVFAKDNCELDFSDKQVPLNKKGEIKEPIFKSNALKEEKKYFIYLPPSYSTSSRRYPVLYLLHGAGIEGKFMPWINQGHIDEILENLIAEYGIEEMILVMSTHGRSGLENGCSGPAEILPQVCGNYEDYIVKDLIPLIDSTYRTINDKSARGIMGFSSGGHGAYWIAFRNPERFSFVAGYSGYYQAVYFVNLVTNVPVKVFSEVKIPPRDMIKHMTLYFEASHHDIIGANKQAKKFHERLEKAGIEHTFVLSYNGLNPLNTHYWPFIKKNAHKAILAYSESLKPILVAKVPQ